jgi:hypothetical protein
MRGKHVKYATQECIPVAAAAVTAAVAAAEAADAAAVAALAPLLLLLPWVEMECVEMEQPGSTWRSVSASG